jgi:hypothetical protein
MLLIQIIRNAHGFFVTYKALSRQEQLVSDRVNSIENV